MLQYSSSTSQAAEELQLGCRSSSPGTMLSSSSAPWWHSLLLRRSHGEPWRRSSILAFCIAAIAMVAVIAIAVSIATHQQHPAGLTLVANASCDATASFDELLMMPDRVAGGGEGAGGVAGEAAIEIPPLPSLDSGYYSYAYEHAILVLPPACVRAHNLEANAAERPTLKTLWVGRLHELPATSPIGELQCGCGWVFFLHGSGGFTYDNWRYATLMASAGYAVIAPDSFAASPSSSEPVVPIHEPPLRNRVPVTNLAAALARNASTYRWWCDDNVYADGGCASFDSPAGYPLCYSSDAEAILSHPQQWRSYYARVFELRRRELLSLLRRLELEASASVFGAGSRLFLAGESEGGMVASRFYDAALHARLAGVLVLQWSCEYNYYVPCASDAAVCEGRCDPSTPVLAVIAQADPFFSATKRDSIAATVARARGHALSGECFEQMAAQHLEHAASVILPQDGLPQHGLTEAAPNLLRALLPEFLAAPRDVSHLPTLLDAARWCRRRETASTTSASKWSCDEIGNEPLQSLGVQTPCSTWEAARFHEQYLSVGPREACAM